MGLAAKSTGVCIAATMAGVLPCPATASAAVHVVHREPLPTVEVAPPPRRARLIDVRGPLQIGWGWSTLHRAPIQSLSFEASASVLEITDTTWLHFTFGEHGVVPILQDPQTPPGLFGVDVGLGLSRYAPRGPAFLVTGTAGPRWHEGGAPGLRPDGFGVIGKAEVFPFYATVPQLVDDERGWFRRYVLSGLDLWVSARYDQVAAGVGAGWSGGLGLDVGRSLILPVLVAVERRCQGR